MAPDAVVTERVYASVKSQILGGRLAPGRRLEVKRIAYDEQVSITPVRDAIHRLVGEKLLEFQGHGGFQVPILSEAGLRDLYAWHLQLVRLGLVAPLRERATTPELILPEIELGIDQIVGLTETLFGILIARSPNRDLRNAGAATAERLRPVRLAEIPVIAEPEQELVELGQLIVAGNDAVLPEAILLYHERRTRHVADIVEQLHIGTSWKAAEEPGQSR